MALLPSVLYPLLQRDDLCLVVHRLADVGTSGCRIVAVKLRRNVLTLLLAFLLLASSSAMCEQCQVLAGGPNQNSSHGEHSGAEQQTPATTTSGEHCGHRAKAQSRSAAYLISAGRCPDKPCRQTLDAVRDLHRSNFAQLTSGVRSTVAGGIFGADQETCQDALCRSRQRSRQRSRFKPICSPSLSVSLKI
jgi:hypothetical protein